MDTPGLLDAHGAPRGGSEVSGALLDFDVNGDFMEPASPITSPGGTIPPAVSGIMMESSDEEEEVDLGVQLVSLDDIILLGSENPPPEE